MRNSSAPAYPCSEFDFERMSNGHFGQEYDQYTHTFGLTKRELFAIEILKGLEISIADNGEILAIEKSVRMADMLLNELDDYQLT